MKIGKIIFLIGIALFLSIIYITFNQPGEERYAVEFKEIDFLRNENNTGPINRIYAIYVQDSAWQDMASYAASKPYTKYGSTKVFFFIKEYSGQTFLSWNNDHIPENIRRDCIASYHKENNGRVRFLKYPFSR